MNTVKDATGQNLDWFFQQFLYKPGHPIFDVSTTWDADKGVLNLKILQLQDTSMGVPIYRVPVEIGLVTSEGKRVERIWLEQAEENYHFKLPERALLVRFDEGNRLLKEWSFPKETAELIYQAKNDDVIGREWAIRELAPSANNPEVVACLMERTNVDSFWAVRKAAVEVLHQAKGKSLNDLYRSRLNDSNSKVRVSALHALASSKDLSHLALFRERFEQDDSYLAQAEALRAIGMIGSQEDLDYLKQAAAISSPFEMLRQAAHQAISQIRARQSR
jgi:aminopeptidase N